MRLRILFILLLISVQLSAQVKNFHQLKATTIDGEVFDFALLKGKKVMVVNTASECALTPQFKKLQELYEEYGGEGFEIIGFPCNDFGKQDPGSNREISEFCTKKYGVSFLMMEKISIKGENKHPVYEWLTSSEKNGTLDAKVSWNFQKFLISKNGEVIDFIPPVKSAKSNRVIEWLNEE